MTSTALKKNHKTKRPKTLQETLPNRPKILVTGGRDASIDGVARSLGGLRAEVETTDWNDYPQALNQGVAAMMIVEPLPVTLAGAIAAVRGQPAGEHLPLYALVAPGAGARKVRSIYLAGATAVIEWPREKRLLADILTETMGMSLVRGPSTFPDAALTRTVRAHLRAGPRPGSSVRLSSRKGVVTVSGEVDTLAEAREVVETVSRVPGVRHILSSDLRVPPSGLSDRRIRSGVKAVIRAMSDLDENALEVTVRNGHVRLAGVVPRRAQFHRLLDSIVGVRGIRDLDWNIQIAERPAETDAKIARRLRAAIETLHPNEAIEVRIAGGVAVLSGRTRQLITKRAVERLVERDEGVVRVVNKLSVGRRAAGGGNRR